jgi:diguanylate cyclase (GGDEF)-like protein
MLDDDGEPLRQITISIGVAQLPAHGEDIRTLIELADLAMYRAKSSGRNRVVLWDDEMVGEKAAA